MSEEELHGGTMTSVVRVGDTVRRSTGEWSAAGHAVLRHLATPVSTVRRAFSASTTAAARC